MAFGAQVAYNASMRCQRCRCEWDAPVAKCPECGLTNGDNVSPEEFERRLRGHWMFSPPCVAGWYWVWTDLTGDRDILQVSVDDSGRPYDRHGFIEIDPHLRWWSEPIQEPSRRTSGEVIDELTKFANGEEGR